MQDTRSLAPNITSGALSASGMIKANLNKDKKTRDFVSIAKLNPAIVRTRAALQPQEVFDGTHLLGKSLGSDNAGLSSTAGLEAFFRKYRDRQPFNHHPPRYGAIPYKIYLFPIVGHQ